MKSFAVLVLVLAAAGSLAAKDKDKEQVKPQVIDAGTWGIFVNGKRVASEKFRIEQTPSVNRVTTETRTEDGSKAEQRSDLQVTSTGELQRYEWHEISPGKSEAVVEPSSQFLIEHMVPNPPDKPRDVPFLVSTSTLIMDDNIFTHRQIIAWRYLAADLGGSCTDQGNIRTCQPAKSSFGVLVPKEGVSDSVSILYAGRHSVNFKGAQRDLDRFDLSSEATGNWVLWMDENKKVVMISIPESKIEVVRD